MIKRILLVFFLLLPSFVGAEEADFILFYSESCSFCAREREWISESGLVVEEYSITENGELLQEFYEEYDVPNNQRGLVPANFVGDQFILGFSGGDKIIQALEGSKSDMVKLPIVGEIDTSRYSLLGLTVGMGLLDGFNICSLGAVVFVLGLTLALKDRKKVLFYGGLFVLTTAVVYGVLILLWYQLFSVLSNYLRWMELAIGLLSVGGGLYFLKEFWRFYKLGPTCDSKEIGSGLRKKIKDGVQGSMKPLTLVGTLLLFGAFITIVEFPCSAAVPVVYAGILANKGLGVTAYLSYIVLFVLFYLLDELVVFGIAVSKMTIWLESPKFVTWVTFIEAIVLILLGAYYLL